MTTKIERPVLDPPIGALPPHPHEYPVVGALPSLLANPVRFCTRMMLEHNDLVCLDLGFGTIYLVTLPEHIHHVLVENHDNYWKGDVFERTRFLFGNGLVVNEGESWRRQHKLMQPAFAHRRVAALVPVMTEVVERRLAGWEAIADSGQPFEIGEEMMSLTLGIIVKTMFSLSVDDHELEVMARCFCTALEQITIRMATYFLPDKFPLPHQRATREAVETLEVDGLQDHRRAPQERPGRRRPARHAAGGAGRGDGRGDDRPRDPGRGDGHSLRRLRGDRGFPDLDLVSARRASRRGGNAARGAGGGARRPDSDLRGIDPPHLHLAGGPGVDAPLPALLVPQPHLARSRTRSAAIRSRPAPRSCSAPTRPTGTRTTGACPNRSIPSASSPPPSPPAPATPTSPSAPDRGCASAAISR